MSKLELYYKICANKNPYSPESDIAEHGSYVGWCMENVSGFDIEPEDLKHRFIQEYNQWKHRIETRNLTPFQRGWETTLREDWEECDTRPW